jgi:hypothetical protein
LLRHVFCLLFRYSPKREWWAYAALRRLETHTHRVKTETATRLPLLPQALKIIEGYKDHRKCVNEGKLLAVMSNQKMNEYLKEIAELVRDQKEDDVSYGEAYFRDYCDPH